jgi:hypothetical protein
MVLSDNSQPPHFFYNVHGYLKVDIGEMGGIMMSGNETRATKTSALMNKHMAAFIVSIVGNHQSSYGFVRLLISRRTLTAS